MSKRVIINEGSNQVKEVTDDVGPSEKWVSKDEIDMHRKEAQAEALLARAREGVTTIIMETNNKKDNDGDVNQMVDKVMATGIDNVMQFLSQRGQTIAPPAVNDQTENPELQVRNLVHQKIIFLHKKRNRPISSEEALEVQANQIMQLPKPQILEFLRQQERKFNWVLDSKDAWADLPNHVQQAAAILGYNEELWDSEQLPDESDKFWEDLTQLQQKAATFLGYNSGQWNGSEGKTLKSIEESSDDDSSEASGSEISEGLESEGHNLVGVDDGAFKDYNAEVIMMQKIRELLQFKFQRELSIDDPSDPVLERAVNEIMSLPREQIKQFLQLPLLPLQAAEEDSTETNEDAEAEDEFLTNFLGVESEPTRESQQASFTTADETEFSESNETSRRIKDSNLNKQLETFVNLWAFNTLSLDASAR